MRKALEQNRSYFPPDIPISFLGAWIERESDGRYGLRSRLGEIGYFQLHPEEIRHIWGAESEARIAAQVTSSPTASIQWGGRYLSWYDKQLTALGVPRNTNTYLGLMKAMHWSPSQTPRWVRHVKHATGSIPTDYAGFILVASQIGAGTLPRAPGVSLPSSLPSCSSFFVLDRMGMFPARRRIARNLLIGSAAAVAVGGAAWGAYRWGVLGR